MYTNKSHCSSIGPIASISSLALHLGIPKEELVRIADNSGSYWRKGKEERKKDGTPRKTHDAKEPLKSIQEKINARIFRCIVFPDYLYGSLPGRDYKQHALCHAGKKCVIVEDVKDFFPSTSEEKVRLIWQRYFNFTPEVAEVLTKLTTYKGELPQGWKTSSYLANLAFWDVEPELVNELMKIGLEYSRYMDDICASANFNLTNEAKTEVISGIYGMMRKAGYSPKRSKHKIMNANKRMVVTNLTVNTSNPTLPKKERARIHTAVHQLELGAMEGRTGARYCKSWNSAFGKVNKIKRFHPHRKSAEKSRERLAKIKPQAS